MDTDCSRDVKMELRAEHWVSIIPYFLPRHTAPYQVRKGVVMSSVQVVSQRSFEEVDVNVKQNRPGRIAMMLTIQ